MKRTFQFGIPGLFLALSLTPATAFAQEALVEGPGVQLGEGSVFHPSVSLETGYVSNVFYQDESPTASAVARLIGAFSIASQAHTPEGEMEPAVETEGEEVVEPPPPSQVDFRLGGQVILLGYLTDNEAAREQSDVGVALDGDVVFLPHGDVSFRVTDEFVRDTRPRNFESTGNLNRDFNHFTTGVTLQPQGRTISAGIRYSNIIDRFESDGAAFANRLQHLIGLRGEWRLYPYTKFFADASYGFFGSLGDEELAGMEFHSASNPLRIQVGVGTALTEVTTVRAYVGYGNGFYDVGPNFSNAIGGAEFGYRYTEYGRFRLIADYNFEDSLQANFFRDYTFLANLNQQFGLFVADLDAGVRVRAYRGISPSLGQPDRDDVIGFGAFRLAYLLRDWLAITGRLEATIDSTDYTYMAGDRVLSPEYKRYEAFLGVSAAF
jgi:hypothetical protein